MRSRRGERRTSGPTGTLSELAIDTMAAGGDSVAHVEHDGERRAVFVRGGIPGDRLRVLVDYSRRPARGRLLDVIVPSADRVVAPCPHLEACGACNWMTMAREARRRAHEAEVRSFLPVAAREMPIRFHASAEDTGYRTRTRLHVRVSGGHATVGMHARETHRPVEVDTCLVLHPALEHARHVLPALFEAAHGEGEAQLALGRPSDNPASERPAVLDVRWPGGALPAIFFQRLEGAVKDGALAGAAVRCGEARVPAVVGNPTPWMVGDGGSLLRLPPGGFAQASEEDNRTLAARIDALAGDALSARGHGANPDARTVELYAGAGNFSVHLARRTTRLVTVEGDAIACRAAEENLRAHGLRARVVHGDAATFPFPKGTDSVVLDPPRTGARDAVLRMAEARVRHVLYVSCAPPTLGRDLAHLFETGYRLLVVEIFEMFPQTSHVESVVLLERTEHARRDKGQEPRPAS